MDAEISVAKLVAIMPTRYFVIYCVIDISVSIVYTFISNIVDCEERYGDVRWIPGLLPFIQAVAI